MMFLNNTSVLKKECAKLSFITWMIIGCEIGFWIVILLGLIVRYIFKQKKLGLMLLALTPLIDLLLLIITSIDLYQGAVASTVHGIAAIYIGVSIVFGKSMIKWADERFQYYVMKEGTKPEKRYGMEYAIHYFKGWLKHLLSYLIGNGLIFAMIYFINDSSRTQALFSLMMIWSVVLVIDLIISISNFIWPKKDDKRVVKQS